MKTNNTPTGKTQKAKIDFFELERVVMDAAHQAADYIRQNAFNYGSIEWKGLDDPVTICDKTAEKMIESRIKSDYDANFIGEEYGVRNNKSELTFYIDPIDGTKSFTKGEFLTTISIAAKYKEEVCIGCVYDFMRGIMYYANPIGAFMRYEHTGQVFELPLRKSSSYTKKVILATEPQDNAGMFASEKDIRIAQQTGSIALAMAQTAAGVYEGIIRNNYSKKNDESLISDILAGYYILKQAGFSIKKFDGQEYDYRKASEGFIATRNGTLDAHKPYETNDVK